MQKNIIAIFLMLSVSSIFGQDYLITPDGSKKTGKIISMVGNTLSFKNKDGETHEYKINKLSVIHISDSDFKMKGVYLSNSKYDKTDNGIHIEMLDNPIVSDFSSNNSNKKSSTTNVNINSEVSSSLSITNEDDNPKSKIVLRCLDCANSGTLSMESEDKLSKVLWNYDVKEGTAFPMEIEMNSNKVYNFRFKEANKRSIEKKVTIKSGVNYIKVFE